MKTKFGSAGILLALLALGPQTRAPAEFPLPAFTYYGEVRNAYGWSYRQADNAQIVVRVGGRECARAMIDERLGPGMNYRVQVPLDDGQGALYASFAARQGDRPTFVVVVGSQEFQVMDPTDSIPIGDPGSRIRQNFFRDTDTDGDGLPDTWEYMILEASQGAFANISQIMPEDDFDGDGVKNLAEFIAGTDPTWNVDRLEVDTFIYRPDLHLFAVGFYSVRAKSYELQGADSMMSWQGMDFSVNAANNATQKFWRGDGYYSWLFVDTFTSPQQLFRLRAQ